MRIEGGRFLVIGGAGFIGSHLVDQLLAKGAAEVRVFDDFSRGTQANIREALRDERCHVCPGAADIRDRDAIARAAAGCDGSFHLAALWLLECQEQPQAAFDVNVAGTMNVVEAVRSAGVRRLVFSSSASVYGDAQDEPMQETHPLACQEMYGASKVCGEMVLRAMGNRPEGVRWVGLRYMNVYGARQDDRGAYVGVVTRMLRDLDHGGIASIHGDGSQSYDFIDVGDCARANLCAMESDAHNECFNIGTGVKTSIRALAEKIVSLRNRGETVSFDGMPQRVFVRNRVGDPSLAGARLGFTAQIQLTDGLRELVGALGRAAAAPQAECRK